MDETTTVSRSITWERLNWLDSQRQLRGGDARTVRCRKKWRGVFGCSHRAKPMRPRDFLRGDFMLTAHHSA